MKPLTLSELVQLYELMKRYINEIDVEESVVLAQMESAAAVVREDIEYRIENM